MRILVVSSSISVRRVLTALLGKESGASRTIIESHSYSHARDQYLANPFDLVLLGDQAEGGSPLAFLESLHAHGDWHPVLFIHGGSDAELSLEVLRHGSQDALEIGQLSSERLRLALLRIQQTQELRRQNQHFAAELKRSNQELEQFAHTIGHDLREPLRKVQSFGTLLGESLAGRLSEEETFFLNRIINGAERMGHMIHDVLEYGHAGRSHDNAPWLPLGNVLRQVQEDLELALQESGAKLQITGSFPAVQGEPVRLHQLLQNLLANAIKYRRPDTPLVIQILTHRQADQSLCLQVQDNGQGFPPAQSEAIFRLFNRLHAQDSTASGYGIGLALCRRIAESLGGTLTATGLPDQGATFTLTLTKVRWDPESA